MARKFHFRLRTVERLRKQAVDQQRRIVAEAQRAAGAAEEANAARNRELEHEREAARQRLDARVLDLPLLRSQQLFRAWLKGKAVETVRQAVSARADLGRERACLAEASKRLKVIEKLRERQWQRHTAAAQRAEQALYDEAALQRYVRGEGARRGE